MTETKVRKAVVKMEDVKVAFAAYVGIRQAVIGDVQGHSFDKGFRGRGFAQYDSNDNVVRTFESREDALNYYKNWADIASEVLVAIRGEATNIQEVPESHASEEAIEAVSEETTPEEVTEEKEDKPVRRSRSKVTA